MAKAKKKVVNAFDGFTTGVTPDKHRKNVFKEEEGRSFSHNETDRTSQPFLNPLTTIQRPDRPVRDNDDGDASFIENCCR